MSRSEQLTAYLATLAALVAVLALAFSFAAFNGVVLSKIEAFGLGTVTGGLIGALRAPGQRHAEASEKTAPHDPGAAA